MSEQSSPEYISAQVSEDFKKHVRVAAAKRDMTISEFIRQTLRREIQQEP